MREIGTLAHRHLPAQTRRTGTGTSGAVGRIVYRGWRLQNSFCRCPVKLGLEVLSGRAHSYGRSNATHRHNASAVISAAGVGCRIRTEYRRVENVVVSADPAEADEWLG